MTAINRRRGRVSLAITCSKTAHKLFTHSVLQTKCEINIFNQN